MMKSAHSRTKAQLIEEIDYLQKQVKELRQGHSDAELKEMEEELRESEKKLKYILEILPIGISIIGAEHNMLYVNLGLEKILGISREDLLKGNYKGRKYLRPDETPMPAEELASTIAFREQSVIHNVETGIVKEDGSIIWTNVSAVPVAFPDWKVVVVTRDITARKRIEKAQRESKKRLRGFMESAIDGFLLFDSELNNIEMNKAAQEIIGTDRIEVLGKNIIDVIPDIKESGRYDKYKEVIETGKPFFLPNHLFHGKYGLKNIDLKVFKVGDGLGVIFSDITKRKQAEDAVKQSERKYKSLFNEDISGDYVVTPSGEFQHCNKAFVKMFGYHSLEEVYSTNASTLYEKKEHRKEFLSQLNKKKKLNLYEHELVRKDGEIITVLENALGIFNDDGKLIQISGYIIDITERKQMERELRETLVQLRNLASHLQTIREEERAKIARNIHDDMGQILAMLKINLSLIESEIKAKKTPIKQMHIFEELKDMQDIVDNAITRTRELVRELRPEVLDNLGLLEALKWLANEFENQNQIKCFFTTNVRKIDLDMHKSIAIFRILQEILTNVLRHSKATTVKINFNKENGNLILRVNDNGIGFSKKKISDPNSLGLLGMRERALVFKGEMEIIFEKGKGTTLTVSIPLN